VSALCWAAVPVHLLVFLYFVQGHNWAGEYMAGFRIQLDSVIMIKQRIHPGRLQDACRCTQYDKWHLIYITAAHTYTI
jgi:hypothetical protein